MQVRTPARQPGPRVRLDDVPSCYEAKQAGLDRTLLAAYTGTRHGHTRDRPLGSHGHYILKSTPSAARRHRPGNRPRLIGSRGGYGDGTAASDLMSMRQPVSLAASLAFWPSLPIASDSW